MKRIYVYGGRKWARNFKPEWNGRLCEVLKTFKKPRNCWVKFLDNGEIAVTNMGLLSIYKRD